MSGRKRGKLPEDLQRVQERFQTWRAGRKAGDRIPLPLWRQAVKIAQKHGVSRTATALKLDYYGLKRRLASATTPERPTAREEPSADTPFVELPVPAAFHGECLIEFEDGTGSCLRVHLKGHQVPDLLALSQHFWNGE